MKRLIEAFKNRRKRKYIVSKNTGKYAFIGMGMHSIDNLYPLINYFRLDLKYIVTKSPENAQLIDENFPHSEGTNDLDKVLADDSIKGVFISTAPSAHFGLVKKVLEAGKNVFVEKPPCLTSNELDILIETEKQSNGRCLVGLQKQYAPSNLELKNHLAGRSCSYNYKFCTGAYPEGNPVMDLFIHPISLVCFLFKTVKNKKWTVHKDNSSVTIFMLLEHENNTKGMVELSTNYSWQNPVEELVVNSAKGTYTIKNTESLLLEPKMGTFLGIPKEKVLKNKRQSIHLVERNNFVPNHVNNQLFSSGYFGEVKSFVEMCESGSSQNNSSLSSFKAVYTIISELSSDI